MKFQWGSISRVIYGLSRQMNRLFVFLGQYWIWGIAVLGVTWFGSVGVIKAASLIIGILIGIVTLVSKCIEAYNYWVNATIREELRAFLREESEEMSRDTVEDIHEILRRND